MFHWLAAVVRVRLSPRGDSGVDFPEDMSTLNKFIWCADISPVARYNVKHVQTFCLLEVYVRISKYCINITIIFTVSNQSE